MLLKMLELDAFDDFDYYFLLDADEFLAVEVNEELEIASDLIHSYLASLPNLGSPLKIVRGLASNPHQAGYFQKIDVEKTFFRRETAKWLDIGYHSGQTILRGTPFESSITLIDFHLMGLDEVKKRARQKLEGRVKLDAGRELLDQYVSEEKEGFHCVQ